MTIINKGILDTEDLYERRLSNDWPVAQSITTAEVVESPSNLYYTNTRVQAYLDTQGVSGLDLSSNTTTDLAEGNNLYYTNARVDSRISELSVNVLSDVDITGVQTDYVLAWDGSKFVPVDAANAQIQAAIDAAVANLEIDVSNINVDFAIISGQVSSISNWTTSNLTEGINLYYTNARVVSHLEVSDIEIRNLTVAGNLNVLGNTTTLNATELHISDPIVHLASNNEVSDALDFGWLGHYSPDSGSTLQHAGVFRKHNTDNFYIFSQYVDAELDNGNLVTNINTSDASFKLADIYGNVFHGRISSLDNHDTTDLAEGANLYYTNTRVQSYLDEQGYSTGTSGTDLSGNTTTDLAEGNNLYYTNTRVQAYIESQGIGGTNTAISGGVSTSITRIYYGDNTTTQFAITEGVTANNLLVFENGVAQLPITDYTVSGSILTFGTAPETNVLIQIRELNGSATVSVSNVSLSNNSTTDLAEGANLYYTNTRVQAYLDQIGFESAANIVANIVVGTDLSGNTTTDLAEGNNLYYTNTRVQSYLDQIGFESAANIVANIVVGTDLSGNTTTDLAEGDNLYYTNARVSVHVANLGYATTTYVDNEVANLVASAPAALDTLNELAAALGDDENFASNVIALIATKADIVSLTTANVAELTNLYYTNTRVLSAVNPKLTTANVSELNNLYYTNARVLAKLAESNIEVQSITTAGRLGVGTSSPAYQVEIENTGQNALLVLDRTDGAACFIEGQATRSAFGSVGATPLALAYNSAAVILVGQNGAITVNPDGGNPFTFPTSDGATNNILATDGAGNVYWTGISTDLSSNTTTDLAEGSNLYYTNARVGTYIESFGYLTGINLSGNTTADLAEASGNLYYTNARVQAYLDGQGYSSGVTGTDLSGNTTTDLAEGNNLYYTNARVNSYLSILDGNIIPNTDNVYSLGSTTNRFKDLFLSGNTLVLGGITLKDTGGTLSIEDAAGNTVSISGVTGGGGEGGDLSANTTTDLAEGTNLYYTNTRARSAFTAGQGILLFDGEITADVNVPREQTFDVTVDNTEMSIITDSLETAFTVSSSSTTRQILKSLILTNISQTNVTVNANLVYSGTEYEFANSLSILYGDSIDLRVKPEIIMPGTSYKFQASANDSVSLFATYKTIEDVSFVSQTTGLVSDTYATIYDATDADIIIESIRIINHEGTNLRGTLQIKDSSDSVVSYLAANTLLSANYASELLDNAIRLPLGYKLSFIQFSGRGTAIVSGRKSEAYIITSNVATISEGQSVTFNISTVNIGDGATRYFRTLGNVNSNDFVEGNTGSFVVSDDSATVTLTANLDLSPGLTDAGEQFRLIIAKLSETSSEVGRSNIISIIDTSNIVGLVSSTPSANAIFETEAVVFTVNAANGEGNNAGTFYYTVTGNAIIFGANTGSFIINDNIANIEIIAELGVPVGGYTEFALQLRQDSVSGIIQQTTDYVKVYSSQITGMTATGGNQILEIDI